jgi:hypothetical protein
MKTKNKRLPKQQTPEFFHECNNTSHCVALADFIMDEYYCLCEVNHFDDNLMKKIIDLINERIESDPIPNNEIINTLKHIVLKGIVQHYKIK